MNISYKEERLIISKARLEQIDEVAEIVSKTISEVIIRMR